MRLKEIRSCLITGATSGIGKALALDLGKRGVHLLLTGRNEEELKQLKEKTGGEIFAADLSSPSSANALLQWIDEKNPNLQIHNAGYGIRGPFEQLSEQEVIDMINVNCTALALQTRSALARWKKRGEKGLIVNIASIVGHLPFPFSALYSATKAFVRSLSLSVGGEQDKGIKVLVSCPGPVETDFFRRAAKDHLPPPRGFAMPVQTAVDSILLQIQTEKKEVIFDWKYALFTRLSAPFAPISFLRYLSLRSTKK